MNYISTCHLDRRERSFHYSNSGDQEFSMPSLQFKYDPIAKDQDCHSRAGGNPVFNTFWTPDEDYSRAGGNPVFSIRSGPPMEFILAKAGTWGTVLSRFLEG